MLFLSLATRIHFTTTRRRKGTEGKLYAQYTKEKTQAGRRHIFLEAQGKGHYVGTVLTARGIAQGATPFFEGDDSTATDGMARIHGTGTEDYFNGGWYDVPGRWDAVHSGPLSGCLGYLKSAAATGGYRFYLSDKIPFQKSIYHAIEHGPDLTGVEAVYESVAFYYKD